MVGAMALRGSGTPTPSIERLRRKRAFVRKLNRSSALGPRRFSCAQLGAARLSGPGHAGSGLVGVFDAVRVRLPRDAFWSRSRSMMPAFGFVACGARVLGELEASEEFESAREVERPQPVGDGSQRRSSMCAWRSARCLRGAAMNGMSPRRWALLGVLVVLGIAVAVDRGGDRDRRVAESGSAVRISPSFRSSVTPR